MSLKKHSVILNGTKWGRRLPVPPPPGYAHDTLVRYYTQPQLAWTINGANVPT